MGVLPRESNRYITQHKFSSIRGSLYVILARGGAVLCCAGGEELGKVRLVSSVTMKCLFCVREIFILSVKEYYLGWFLIATVCEV